MINKFLLFTVGFVMIISIIAVIVPFSFIVLFVVVFLTIVTALISKIAIVFLLIKKLIAGEKQRN